MERELLPAEDVEEKMQKQFVCVQLLSIFSVMDLLDEVGRLVSLCKREFASLASNVHLWC